jgi:hypothetical protein
MHFVLSLSRSLLRKPECLVLSVLGAGYVNTRVAAVLAANVVASHTS